MVGDWRAALMATPVAPRAIEVPPGRAAEILSADDAPTGGVPPRPEPVTGENKRKQSGAGPSGTYKACQADTESDDVTVTSQQTSLSDAVMELVQLMKNQTPNDPLSINFAQLDDFAGTVALNNLPLGFSYRYPRLPCLLLLPILVHLSLWLLENLPYKTFPRILPLMRGCRGQ
ncbi:hypothetical protein Salat_2828400 [Sesamum alatum]|uniref:Uncharacterized protein n=1 Tax=Sesamum alatum TaxID=300844 RepID=A0AAE2C9R0_9LAMI|nr:hypothetical protein Salat_2828400 [Sesamum alatum]